MREHDPGVIYYTPSLRVPQMEAIVCLSFLLIYIFSLASRFSSFKMDGQTETWGGRMMLGALPLRVRHPGQQRDDGLRLRAVPMREKPPED